MPGAQVACESMPLRRCISVGGATGTASSSSSITRKSRPGVASYSACSTASKSAAPAPAASTFTVCRSSSSSLPVSSSSTSEHTSSGSNTGTSALTDALLSVTTAASTTASVLSSVRQQHEEALLRQREQFQIMMENMRTRMMSVPRLPGGEHGPAVPAPASPNAGRASPSSVAGSDHPCPCPSMTAVASHSPYRSPLLVSSVSAPSPPQAVPTSAMETYRGVQFSIPLGCRIEDGEAPGEVRVTGPRVQAVLQFRGGGRQVLLVSSNCVCTVKRMGGRVAISVLAPLAAPPQPSGAGTNL